MKRFFPVLCLALLILARIARADGPDDQYVAIYSLIQQGDLLSERGQSLRAIARYDEAQKALQTFQTNYPDWNVKVVQFRLKYIGNKITRLSFQPQSILSTNQHAPIVTNTSYINTSNAAPTAQIPGLPLEPGQLPAAMPLERQISDLQDRVRDLETDKSLLQAKLKEALAAQPVPIDPQEFARTQDQVKGLQKENALLKTSLDEARKNATEFAAKNSENLQKSLDESNQKIAQLSQANTSLLLQYQTLQTSKGSSRTDAPDTTTLHDENSILKKQLSDLQGRVAAEGSTAELIRQLKTSQAQLASLQSDREILRLEKTALEEHIKQMSLAAPAVVPTPDIDNVTTKKLAELQSQRNALQVSLDAANRDLQSRKKGKEASAHLDDMNRQLTALRGRIDVLEAHPVAYSPTELALLSQSNTTTLFASTHVKRAMEIPPDASVKLAEAQRYFAAHDLEKAESKYLEVLKLDEKNVVTLADLGSIELELGHYNLAETNLKRALAIDPNDDYSLFVLGQLKFREKSYEEALDALSRAAQLNPGNARVQNFLGLTLTEKGLRGPAETAFRKAIQFDPGFADAHINLAVVYITQNPPLAELARWHYQKALASGHSPNAALEKLLNSANMEAVAGH